MIVAIIDSFALIKYIGGLILEVMREIDLKWCRQVRQKQTKNPLQTSILNIPINLHGSSETLGVLFQKQW